jgi:hypothetical protein
VPPAQQAWPVPPHVVPPPLQLPLAQVMPVVQVPSTATQLPFTQQADAAQVDREQHGSPAAPQLTTVPAEQTWPLVDAAVPEAKQIPEAQQPPPLQVLPAQQLAPGTPHTTQRPPVHAPPVEHVALVATHWEGPGSQQPLEQVPAQHGWPGLPHWTHTP